jgi:cytochrome c biogenesis protein CcmG, thiol:disulfide interchange protein DsbE
MRRTVVAIVLAVAGVALIALLAFGFGKDPSVIASPLIDKPAPVFTLKTLDGKSLSLRQLKGRPVVVNFWASWCLECKVEHPYLVDAWSTYPSTQIAFVGVVYQDSPSAARSFMEQHGGGWPSVMDPGGLTAINYGVYGVPETFFIDARGIIRYKQIGPVTPELLVQQIDRLVHEKT